MTNPKVVSISIGEGQSVEVVPVDGTSTFIIPVPGTLPIEANPTTVYIVIPDPGTPRVGHTKTMVVRPGTRVFVDGTLRHTFKEPTTLEVSAVP